MNKKLGAYEVLELIGAGGMGEVYRARDTKLGREVAIKVLPEALSQDKERLARFEREAKLLASLNHPGIATLYGLEEDAGKPFLVMELVEGETLAEQIARGPISVDEALPLFIQIAEGLEAAHEKGIIHRDLKPANIKITPDNNVKILDFGLAKAFLPEDDVSAETSQSPTLTRGTALGAIMGTASYMSPEQARGKPVDKRTDVWAFGCCLYETLNAKRPFDGENITDILAAVVRAEPELEKLPSDTPAAVQRMIRRCLTKDRRQRLRDIGDARIELIELPEDETSRHKTPARSSMSTLGLGALLGASVTAALFWFLFRSANEDSRPVVRSSIPVAPAEYLESGKVGAAILAISPDGTHVAYTAETNGEILLHVRALERPEAVALAGTQGAHRPFFSPDGQWVGFFSGQKLKKISVAGGNPQVLADAEHGQGGAWSQDGTIIYAPIPGGGLARVAANGGPIEVLTTPDADRDEAGHLLPSFLPGERDVLFSIELPGKSNAEAKIAVLSLDAGSFKVLVDGAPFARYAPSGHLVYGREGTILAAPFDLSSLELTGPAVRVVDDITWTREDGVKFDFSRNGSLVYVRGGETSVDSNLAWVDRKGVSEVLPAPERRYTQPSLSPDGSRVAVAIQGANDHVWLLDLARGTLTRQSFDNENLIPVWRPDGRAVAIGFHAVGRPPTLHLLFMDGSGRRERLLESELTQSLTSWFTQFPTSWSLDGNRLAYIERSLETGRDIWILQLEDDKQPIPFQATPFEETHAMFSPDGEWLAYVSDETGRSEVYVRALNGTEKHQISSEGGTEPVWSRNGKELFYRNGNRMMAVAVETQPTFRPGATSLLFQKASAGRYFSDLNANYDVSLDGRRFLIVEPVDPFRPTEITLVQNWFEELKRLVPTE